MRFWFWTLSIVGLYACGKDALAPVRLADVNRATIPVPMGPPWVAVPDTAITWVGWQQAVQVLANDSGLVNVTSSSSSLGISVAPYHKQWIMLQPATVVGEDTIVYTAVDTTGSIQRTSTLDLMVEPVPAGTDLQVTLRPLPVLNGQHRLEITSRNNGPVTPPIFALVTDSLPNGSVFKTTQNDRCAPDVIPGNRVTCQRPAIAPSLAVVDTLRFSKGGTYGVTVKQPGVDPVAGNDHASVVIPCP